MSTKDTYLYFQTRDRLSCVNISQLCDKRCPNPRELTIVYDNSECKYPVGMGYVIVDSKLYMIGGEIVKLEEGASIDDPVDLPHDVPPDWLNLEDVYAFDPNASSLVKCPSSNFPRLLAPKTKPLVVTLEDNKVYVLSTDPHLCYTRTSELPRPLFEVFDPVVKTWKPLPDPPVVKPPCYLDLRVLRHFAWGHTLVICNRYGRYAFDAREQRWYNTQGKRIWNIVNGAAAVTKLKGFVIVLPRSCCAIHAFPITDDDDDDDVPASSCREPLEIYDLYRAIGTPFVDCGDGYIFHLDEHRLCFLIDGNDSNDKWCAKVAIFRFSTITSPPGLSFELEAVQIYPMEHMNINYQILHNAFIIGGSSHCTQKAHLKRERATLNNPETAHRNKVHHPS